MSFEEAVRETDVRFTDTFNRGDTKSLVGSHADDFLLLPSNGPTERGAKAARSGLQELMDAGWKNLSFETMELGSEGSLGYHVGQCSADVPAENGGTKREKGKYVDVYKRLADGSWKIHVTMFNSDESA